MSERTIGGHDVSRTSDVLIRILAGILPAGASVTDDTPLHAFGLDSLMATRIRFEVQKTFSLALPMERLAACENVRQLSDHIDRQLDAGRPSSRSLRSKAPAFRSDVAARFAPFPLTPVQEAYLIGKQGEVAADPVGCHLYREFEMADLDADRLRAAWDRLIRHHDMLRATVTADGMQRIEPHAPAWTMPVHDLSQEADEAVAACREAVRRRMSHCLYAPGQSPGFAIEVTRGRDGRCVVHLSVDAMLTDGHGLDLLLRQWSQCYWQPDCALPETPVSLRDSVLTLRAQERTPTYQDDSRYWAERLTNMPPGPALGWVTKPDTLADCGCFERSPLSVTLDAHRWRAIRDRAAALNVSPTAFVLTLFIEALARVGASPPFSLVVTTNTRTRLPADAKHLVGPFTDTMVFVAPDTLGQGLDEAVQLVHAHLWRDLAHDSVGGVAALRSMRARDRQFAPPPLAVVFTSLLNIGIADSAEARFGDDVTFAVSQTSGVFLDHQMWEQNGELHVRWDVAEALFPAGVVEALFGSFSNALHGAASECDGAPIVRPLNQLQRAYYVARVDGSRAVGSGCQVYHGFHVENLDVSTLERAWLDMVATYPALRSHLTHDGQLCIRQQAPDRFRIPVIDLTDAADRQAVLSALRDDMAGRAFALDRWPAFDLRVTKAAKGDAVVHCAIDLGIADGISIHKLFRELFRIAADATERPRPPASLDGDAHAGPCSPVRPQSADPQAYWQAKLRRLPAGPRLAGAPSPDRRRVRLAGRLAAWGRFKERARRHGVSPDAVLLAAFTEALSTRLGDAAFALPVVRWSEADDKFRPGEFTALSWVARAAPELPLPAKAALYQDEIERDAAASGRSGLGELRKLVMKERRHGAFGYPVVYTSVLDLSQSNLPPNARLGSWMTYTPDVSLDCIGVENKDGLHYFWDAVAADFPGDTLESMFAEFRDRLEDLAGDSKRWQVSSTSSALADHRPVAAAPAASPVQVALLGADERRKILYEWNDTAAEFPDRLPVHALFEQRARERPEAVCVRCRDQAVTYGALNREANRIAWRLKKLGVGAESVVAIALPRRPTMVASLLGVLKAGAAYMPIDPTLGDERVAMMLTQTGASVLIAAGAPLWPLPPDVQVLDVERIADRSPVASRNPKPVAGVLNTAYVLFTSGSTGQPKAVAVNHRSILNLLNWCYRSFDFGETDMGLAVTALGFDLSAFDFMGLLGCGASLYLADETEQKDPALLLNILLEQPITFWNSAPSTLNQLAPLLPEYGEHPGAGSLRLVFLSGDYTPLSLPDDVRRVFRNARIVNLGGATEATIWSNFFPVDAVAPHWRSIPYGKPIDNARYHILDDSLDPCAVGVEGDLFIGGECLSLGYLNQPGVTAERFIPDPFTDRPGQRLYRTGDRAAYLEDGNICFLGRRDDQVKIRGFRVELGEIEHCLRQHASVKDAVVLARDDGCGEKRLVAYVVAAAEPPPDASALRAHAAAALPDYMVPNFVSLMKAFPATANGKLDRAALPWPLDEAASRAGPEPSATDALCMEIAALFAAKLDVREVDPQQDLWDQGATSFTMVQVSQALHKRYGRRVPVSTLLADPTAAGIARALADDWPTAGSAGPAPHDAQASSSISPARDAAPASGLENGGPPEVVDVLSAADKARFLAAGHNLRRPATDGPLIRLDHVGPAEEHYRWRSSRTDFLTAPIAHADFCRLLSLLKKTSVEGRTKALYPSAGATYAVQTYLHLKQGAVRGIEPGLYWYNPQEHALQRLSALPGIDRNCHFVYNRPTFDKASFGIFLIGQRYGIEPLYQEEAERFLLLEAGYLGQLLMMGQAACGIGLCPVGALDFDKIRADFALDEGHTFLHAFLGGAVAHHDRAAATRELPVFSGAARPREGDNGIGLDRIARIERYLLERYALASEIPSTELDPRVPLDRYGLNSRLIARLNADLDAEFGNVPRTLFFEHSNLAEIAAYLAKRESGAAGERAASVPAPRSAAPLDDDIAVIGVAGRYPQARDLDRFWDNLQAGLDCITPLPEARRREGWPNDIMWGGFLEGIDEFDPLFFGISPRDAESMDPQERLFLEVAWETLEDAGYPRQRLRERHRSQVGVFVGVMYNEYSFVGVERPDIGPTGSTTASIANRVSYFLDLCGPSMAVDTMCSASLTCMHLAVESLRRRECEVAIVGGVNLSLHPNKFIKLARMKMSSSDHRCRSFGAGGDGFAPGEGVGAVLLKPLGRAVADGDRIHAVIKATAVNHGGKTNGFTVPSPAAQGTLIAEALRRAGVDPATIGYIETHGTGTALGDPVEIEGLTRGFTGESLPPASCAIGSVKSNIGHLEAASGIAGLTKVILQLRHGRLVPSLHARHLNDGIDWERSPFYLQREPAEWLPRSNEGEAVPRRAGISAFGAGGSNAHVILQGYENAPVDGVPSRTPQLIVLSAYDEGRLKAMAERLTNFLRRGADGPAAATVRQLDLAGLADELAGVAGGGPVPGLGGTPLSAAELCAYLQEKYGLRGGGRSLGRFDGAAAPSALEDIAYTLQVGREAMRERLALVATTLQDLCARLDRFCAGNSDGMLRGCAPDISGGHAAPLFAGPDPSDPAAVGQHWVAGGRVDWSRLHAGRRPKIVGLPAYPFYRTRCWPRETKSVSVPAPQAGPNTYQKIWVAEEGEGSHAIGGKIVCLFDEHTATLASKLAERLSAPDVLLLHIGASGGAAMEELRRNEDFGCWIDLCDFGREGDDSGDWKLRLAMLQQLLRNRPAADLTLTQVTRGLLDLAGPAPRLAGARMAGFMRMLGAEFGRVTAKVVDTDVTPDDADRAASEIVRELGIFGATGEVCWRAGRRHVPRLRQFDWPSTPAWQPDPDKAYCVSGGTRGIGALVARHLVRRGVRRLVLLCARSLPPRRRWDETGLSEAELSAVAHVRALERDGAEVMHYTGPLTDAAQLGQFLGEVRRAFGPIGGIVHCAGTASRGRPSFAHKDIADIDAVFEPKVDGLETLAALCAGDPLDFAVLFSSISAVAPALAAGVSDYAAANYAMDIFSGYQSRSGRRGFCSVAWPPWQEFSRGGYNAAAIDRLGLAAIGGGDGLDVLDRVIADPGIAHVVVCPPAGAGFSPDALLRIERGLPPPPLAAPVAPAPPSSETPPAWLVRVFSETLNIPVDRLDPTALFGDLGAESVVLGELLQKIEAQLGRSLEPSLLLEHPTLERLSRRLAQAAAPAAAAPLMDSPDASGERKMAVVGMACRLPDAPDVETFWANLMRGHCAIREVPVSRWDWRRHYRAVPERGKSVSKWGGFVDGIDAFDPDYFGMTDEQATCLDPAVRLLLEGAATCFSDAGYAERELRGRDVGVFVGARMSDYRDRVRRAGMASGLGGDQNFIAACAAHHFDLRGPNLVVDSACSSALVAVNLACQSLQQGQCELALAGGVEVLLDETPYLEFSAARALSPSGRCRAFDQRADGFVPGEGCGVVLLKRLDKALRDGDRVYAVIDAVAVTNDGHTVGLTTPNPQAQARAVRQALAASGLGADDVGMLEAHGTATMIGDPIELRALTDAFRESTDRTGYCAIGSVKSNIGHLLSAAGVAGLLKVVLAIHHGQIPPTLFCETPNPRFDFAASPFFPNAEPRAWSPNPRGLRVAGLSAFGLGGTNVHLIASRHANGGRADAVPARAPLPAPLFRRRRLWLDREPGEAGFASRSQPEPGRAPIDATVASILDLRIERAGNGCDSNAMYTS